MARIEPIPWDQLGAAQRDMILAGEAAGAFTDRLPNVRDCRRTEVYCVGMSRSRSIPAKSAPPEAVNVSSSKHVDQRNARNAYAIRIT